MALSHATFIATYPEFASVSEAYFSQWKAEAALELDAVTYGTRYDSALGLLVGHYLTRFPETAGTAAVSSGPVTGMSTGGMSVSYGAIGATRQGDDPGLLSTAYGQRLSRLQRQTIFTSMVV